MAKKSAASGMQKSAVPKRRKSVATQPDTLDTSLSIGRNDPLEIKRLERERFAKIDIGLLEHPYFLRPCRVKILMLVDNGISYNQFYFGLSEVLDTLRTNPEETAA